MNRVITVAYDILTSLGDLDATWSGLFSCQSGLVSQKIDGFDHKWPLGIIDGLHETIGSNQRLEIIFDRLFQTIPDLPANTSLLCATTKGAVDELLDCRNPYSGQPWHIAGQLSERLNITRESHTISAACASGTIAIIQGAMRIASGECENVLVVGIDLISRFVLSGFASLKALSLKGCRPFDAGRDGLSLGEGAGWILLSSEDNVSWAPGSMTSQVAGWGVSCDATHITAPCREASGLITALQQTTEDGKLSVGGINAHGTGTSYNDTMELRAFSTVWDKPPPVHSVKGAIGHCLGAAGIIEAIIAIMSLQKGVLPPTVGFRTSDNDSVILNGSESLPLQCNSVLSCNSGFGGVNAAILFTDTDI